MYTDLLKHPITCQHTALRPPTWPEWHDNAVTRLECSLDALFLDNNNYWSAGWSRSKLQYQPPSTNKHLYLPHISSWCTAITSHSLHAGLVTLFGARLCCPFSRQSHDSTNIRLKRSKSTTTITPTRPSLAIRLRSETFLEKPALIVVKQPHCFRLGSCL